MDSAADTGRMIQFPRAGQAVISGVTLTRRHTHSLGVTYASGSGVNVRLDGTQVATGLTNGADAGGVACQASGCVLADTDNARLKDQPDRGLVLHCYCQFLTLEPAGCAFYDGFSISQGCDFASLNSHSGTIPRG